ncbi:protein kinase [Streptomyces sp. LRE541]|uniref:serine/threonine-protein kinase n=1 Tax=Streptomyces sp. LRE541 TaxID=2931983 RepID=UPI00200EC816|nr:serine/threonine-protein kinase [Streptomyces sp. LRE541]UPZ29446.1 protein kinase [Streptomyces sp. LRE541]
MSDDGGRLVGGRYRLTERIGSGGMGTVWRATDELVGRDVAVKEPRLPGDPRDAVHQRAYHRLQREARAAARVDHPGAVAIHDVVVEDGLPWIVMELIRGESLHEVLQRGALPPTESARIGLSVVGALKAAHAKGIVHRDVKPANVLLGQHGRVVLTDFGIAHIQGEESLTMSGEFVGSLEFIAPERMSGRGAGPAADMWSLGVCLYAAVEGWSPFRRTTLESTLAAILSAEPPEPEHAGPLGPLIVRLLAKDPDERPDADEVASSLEAVAEGWPTPRGDLTTPQDASVLREFADDSGTVRLGRTPSPSEEPQEAPDPDPDSQQDPAHDPDPAPQSDNTHTDVVLPKPTRWRRVPRLVGGALGGVLLLAGGVWLGTSLTGDDSRSAGDRTPVNSSVTSPETATASRATEVWTARPENDLKAVLHLPRQFVRFHEQGGADDQPRMAIFDNDEVVQVRLTLWDKAPGSPMARARHQGETWAGYGESRTQYTPTSFHGYEAVLADTTYDTEGDLTRVMELMILTDDSRLYELRVDMPKGTADEKRGTAVFKGARERLEIEP